MLLALVVPLLLVAATKTPDTMIVVPPAEARFRPVSASLPDGPQMAVLRGDPATGPSDMLMKMKRSTGRLHIHSADYHLTIVSGEMKHWGNGTKEADAVSMGPGGYWFQPGGMAHADSCLSDECLMFIHWAGPRDGRLAEE